MDLVLFSPPFGVFFAPGYTYMHQLVCAGVGMHTSKGQVETASRKRDTHNSKQATCMYNLHAPAHIQSYTGNTPPIG